MILSAHFSGLLTELPEFVVVSLLKVHSYLISYVSHSGGLQALGLVTGLQGLV